MKKLKQKANSFDEQSNDSEENQDPYEIIYAAPRNEEIQSKILEKAQLNAQMARWLVDVEYNQLLWSDGVYEILEIDPRSSGASYDTLLKIVHPEDQYIREEAQKALFETKKPLEITYRLQMADGRIKWINEICSSDFDQHENPIRFYGIIQDITKYKLSENKFLQKEESYKSLISLLPVGIAVYQDRKFTFINPAGAHLLGAKGANEIIGKPVTKFVHPDSIKDFQKKLNEVVHGMASPPFEEKLMRLDGTVVEAEITPVQTHINGTTAVQVIVNDVTKQKKTEQALKKSEEKFRLLTVTLSDIVWTVNSKGTITYVSPYKENVLGYPAETIIKNSLYNLLSPPSVLSCLIEWEEMKSIVQSGIRMEPRKLILETNSKIGEVKWIEVINTAMYDSDDRFIGFSGICQDITSKKKAEHIVEENNRLRKNELHLKEVIATKDKFLSIIAHDLRSPFNSTIGFLELLLTKYDEFNDEERKDHISLISENATTALNLLENLLVWAKSQTGRMAFNPVKQKLAPILNSVKETFQSAINQKDLTFKISIPDGIEILADTNMLGSIFQNLISNAIKYSRKGGTLLLDVQEIQNQIEMIVSDNGIGMGKETKNRLFKVGEEISIPGTSNEKGSGLGLILCKDFIEKHNGSIVVESEIGKGSQFIVRIPQL